MGTLETATENSTQDLMETQATPKTEEISIQVNEKEINQKQVLMDSLAAMDPGARKQYLGEMLYPLIKSILSAQDQSYGEKLTGMVLELDTEVLVELLEKKNSAVLKSRVEEALSVLIASKCSK